MAVNTILKEVVPEWNLQSYDSEGVSKEVLDLAVEDIMESMESDLINFEEDYE